MILTDRERNIISKKMKGISLTQNESNILSKSIRPKLEEISKIPAKTLIKKLEYNQKARHIEEKIKKIVLKNIPLVDSIIICGSAIHNNYREYNDIDLIISTKIPISADKKNELIEKLEEDGKKENLDLDIQVYAKASILQQYPHSPSLIYQLKDSKIIYGKINIPKNIELSSLDLRMKLDWSEDLTAYATGKEIYHALRNALLVLLLMNKKIDNNKLKETLLNALGPDLLDKLRNNKASKLEKKLALNHLNLLTSYLEEKLKDPKWEKIKIKNH